MPLIYGTDHLHEIADRLTSRYPDQDIILIKNSVMVYAFDASARAIYRAQYPNQRVRSRINLAADGIQKTIDLLQARGFSVGYFDLDAPLNEYLGRASYAPKE